MVFTITINLWYVLYTIAAFFALYFSAGVYFTVKFFAHSSKVLGFRTTMKYAKSDWRLILHCFVFWPEVIK